MSNNPRFSLFTLAFVFVCTVLAQGQIVENKPVDSQRETGHHETIGDPYVPVDRTRSPASPGRSVEHNGYVSYQVNVNALGQNILGDAANEPSIAVDPTDRRRKVIGWRQFDSISNDFRQAGWGYTTDGGATWTFPGVIEPGIFRSDPVLDADAQGNFYYNSLTTDGAWDYWCHVFKSTDGGQSWDEGTYAWGGDKQWQVIDTTGGVGDGHIYASWNLSFSTCSGHFTRSVNDGQSFEPCTYAPGNPYWGTLAVGPDGELYLSGQGFLFDRSVNAKYSGQAINWDLSTTVNLGGSIVMSAGPNPAGLLGQCWVDVDRSDGPNSGNVYMLCSVDPPGSDPLDVMFSRSTNGGVNWSTPQRINTDVGSNAWQWFGTMSVAPNGRIDVVWLDSRDDPGGYDSALYYASSENGGLTWTPNEELTPSFDPHVGWPQQNKMGDYFDMNSDEMGADLAFAGTFNGEQDVYYIRIGDTCFDAGTVDLDSNKYACESTAVIQVNDCGLNTDGFAIDTVQITVDSDSESTGELVELTETGEDTGLFEGALTLSETDSSGVLLIAESDQVTATYIDADDGEGHANVTVTDIAVVDCTDPIISNVQVIDIGPRDAYVTFNTDEPANGVVYFGDSCAALTETAVESGFDTSHSVHLTGLEDNSTYFYIVEAADEAGNPASDDNGGSCYLFSTPDIPDFFTELFSSNDLDNVSLIFTTNGSYDYYEGCVEEIDELPTDPAGGTYVSLSDDDFQSVPVSGGQTVSIYGNAYSSYYIGSNGYITFGGGDTDYTESLEEHFNMPRISALFDDLSPGASDVSWKQFDDRAAVTYENVPEYSSSNQNTFQIEMFFNGDIVISYLGIDATDGLAGLSEGVGLDPDYFPSDLSAMGPCGPKPPTAENGAAVTLANTPVMIGLIATDDGLPEPPALTYVIASLPAHGTLSDPGAGAIDAAPYTLAGGGAQVEYTPETWHYGSDNFTFQANDGGVPPDGGLSNEAVITINITLPESELAINFPLDSDPGWTTEGDWAFGQPTGGGTHNQDPTSGFIGDYVYGYNLEGDYTLNMPAYYLTTTPIDCGDLLNTSLTFRRWLGVERTPFDHASIEISADGLDWTTLWENGETSIADVAWTQMSFDISDVADTEPTVYVRWKMGETDASTTYPGWNIDNIEIWAVVMTSPCFGDLDGDNDVDLADLAQLLSNYGQSGLVYEDGDLDDDGDVDLADLAALLSVYGTTCP